jgi:16S rRNA (guanine527-N7)-methyltransferase
VVLAVRRPDLRVDLVEPSLRRTTFLQEIVDELGLASQVRIVRGRADEREVRGLVGGADRVTARAVAPLARLVRWCLPLVAPDGALLAMKGRRADGEIVEAQAELHRMRARVSDTVVLGAGDDETRVVTIMRRPSDQRAARGVSR